MSIIGDVFGLVTGFMADKKTNKLSREQLELDRMLANRQIDVSKYIEELAKRAAAMEGTFTDPYGSGATFDPASGKYTTQLSPEEKAVQDASFREELDRMIKDQAIRRQGLGDFESMRKRSVGEATGALGDINAFKRGVGRIDPTRVGSQIRADRTGAINAGYDDAARAAQTLQLRTGSSAVGDALSALARDRTRTHGTTMGSPELEGLQFAEGINNDRQKNLFDIYKLFGDEGRAFYDAGYQPSGYAESAYNKGADAMKFDLSKLDLAMGGSGTAATTIGNAQALGQQGFQNFMGNRVVNPTGKFAMGMDAALENAMKKIFSGGIGR